jgi:hypothetical protein
MFGLSNLCLIKFVRRLIVVGGWVPYCVAQVSVFLFCGGFGCITVHKAEAGLHYLLVGARSVCLQSCQIRVCCCVVLFLVL